MNPICFTDIVRSLLSSSLTCCLFSPVMLLAQATVIPVPLSGSAGPTWSQIPFSGFYLQDVPPTRFQQVYAASVFANVIPDGGWISALWFVGDPTVGRQWGAYLPRVEILVTVTPKNPDALSTVFAENLGPNAVTVHPLGELFLTSSPGAGPFIGFQTPFFYNPTDGNLLLQIKNFDLHAFPENPQATPGPLDAYDVLGDPISRVYARGDANATTGIADTLGLTTYFVVTPVPEPAVWLLALLGLPICLTWRRRNRNTTTVAKD